MYGNITMDFDGFLASIDVSPQLASSANLTRELLCRAQRSKLTPRERLSERFRSLPLRLGVRLRLTHHLHELRCDGGEAGSPLPTTTPQQPRAPTLTQLLRAESRLLLAPPPPTPPPPERFVGHCGATKRGTCLHGSSSRGVLPLPLGLHGAGALLSRCLSYCQQCERCKWVSFSSTYRDCSWYTSCASLVVADPRRPTRQGDFVTFRINRTRARPNEAEASAVSMPSVAAQNRLPVHRSSRKEDLLTVKKAGHVATCQKRVAYIRSLSVCRNLTAWAAALGCSRSAFGNTYSAAFCERLAATVHAKVPAVPRAPLELTQQTPISIVHVPKAAGASFIAEAGRLFKHRWPAYQTGIERCYLYQRAEVPLPAAGVHAIMLRSPRAHVWSQHHQCHPATDRAEFARWVRDTGNSSCMPGCSHGRSTCIYDPCNLQARALTCHRTSSHKAIPPEEAEADDVETDGHASGIDAHVAAARRSLDSLDVIGLAEFFHETLCLLWLQHSGALQQRRSCTCAPPGGGDRAEVASSPQRASPRLPRSAQPVLERHVRHGHTTPPLPLDDAPLMRSVDRLTVVDREVYRHALRLFFADVRALEARQRARFLCDARLQEVQPQLAYIEPNLTAMYLGVA